MGEVLRAKNLKMSEYVAEMDEKRHSQRVACGTKLPTQYLKAGVTQRDTFQSMCAKMTGNGRDLVDFALGVLAADVIVEVPTTYGVRHVLMYRGIEITAKEKVWAVEFLANRGFGRAEQNINVTNTIENRSSDELKLEALKLLKKIVKVKDVVEAHQVEVVVATQNNEVGG